MSKSDTTSNNEDEFVKVTEQSDSESPSLSDFESEQSHSAKPESHAPEDGQPSLERGVGVPLTSQRDAIEDEEQHHKGPEGENSDEAVRPKEAQDDPAPGQTQDLEDKKTGGTKKDAGHGQPDKATESERDQISHGSEKLDDQRLKGPVQNEKLDKTSKSSDTAETEPDEAGAGDEIKTLSESTVADEEKQTNDVPITSNVPAEEVKRADSETESNKEEDNATSEDKEEIEETEDPTKPKVSLPKVIITQDGKDRDEFDVISVASHDSKPTKENDDPASKPEDKTSETEHPPKPKQPTPRPRSISSVSDVDVEVYDAISITSDDSALYDQDWDKDTKDPEDLPSSSSPAAQEWARQKREHDQSNQYLDQLMSMVGLEEIKLHFLNVKAEIEAARRRDEEYWVAKGKKILKNDVDKGPNTRNLNLNLVLMGNMGTGMIWCLIYGLRDSFFFC